MPTFLIFVSTSHRDTAAIAASPRQIDALSLSCLLPITASLSPRSTGDGRSEGAFRTSAHPAARLKQSFLTNALKLIGFFSLPSSHAPIRALMIAKRQSISREKTMKAIVAISQMTGSRLGAGTQGR